MGDLPAKRVAALALFGLALTACSQRERVAALPSAPPATAPASPAPQPPAAPNAQTEESDVRPNLPRPQAALPPLPQIGPEALMGLDGAGVAKLIGNPSFTRADGTAQVWQYANRSCVLDVILYEESGKARVTYFEARDLYGAPAAARPCFRAFLRPGPDGAT